MRICPRSAVVLAACFLLSLAGGALPAHGCQICRCGDPTFNALGTDVYVAGAFRIALDWERIDREKGFAPGEGQEEGAATVATDAEEEHPPREGVVENRVTAGFSYSFGERLVGVVRVPWTSLHTREIGGVHSEEDTGGVHDTRDMADPEIYAQVLLWSSNFSGGLGRRAWISALGGVKTDWAKNDLTHEGHRLDEELQPGTGSTAWFGGLSGLYLIDKRSTLFGSVQFRRSGTSKFEYRAGDTTFVNLGYERKFGNKVDGVVELNFRDSGVDRLHEERIVDPNTGGRLLYLTPRVFFDLGKDLVARVAVQVPVYKDLNGEQREQAVANLGLTFLF